MIEITLQERTSCTFPRNEASAQGEGGLCSIDVETLSLGIHRYKYLPFAKNGINCVATEGLDVVSYNFTGCIMAVFDDQGTRKVCHVSTGEGQDCKEEWQRIKGRSFNVFEFRPSDFIDAKGRAFAGCYGLITSDLQTYAITVVSPLIHGGPPEIASIAKAHLLR